MILQLGVERTRELGEEGGKTDSENNVHHKYSGGDASTAHTCGSISWDL